ncbi:hypothetical protein DM02DRAFT_295800 [Periconia macrospinosa]|uniref:Uncharacterized protein n=1 Tax=Periconia macrospinosa TaxID=97972 RepID=A0A2V1D2H5_9PLEO|nr:hypothetical protein DM02DRAFT_295800 [Periconia macrospinosa]
MVLAIQLCSGYECLIKHRTLNWGLIGCFAFIILTKSREYSQIPQRYDYILRLELTRRLAKKTRCLCASYVTSFLRL